MTAFVCLIELELHFNDLHDLKGKRKQLHSLKAGIRQRFGASVAETEAHDKWQRAVLLCALVGDGESEVERRGRELAGWVEARVGEGCVARIDIRSLNDIRG